MGTCQNSDSHKEHEELLIDPNKLKEPCISITAYTWKKDSYNLFDYEAKEITKQRFKISFSGCFSRNDSSIAYNNSQEKPNESLFSLTFSNKDVKLSPKSSDFFSEESCWLIAKSNNNRNKAYQQQPLSEGDYIKLGRVFFHIKEINFDKKPENTQLNFLKDKEYSPCRICLSDAFEKDDPLISPCKCTGSLQYIHLRCLKEWLNSKITTRKCETYSYISWEKLECELCKTNLNYHMQLHGTQQNLIDFATPANYILIETFGKKNLLKGIYVLNTSAKNCFKMGRAVDNEIRINDISVSRTHASLNIVNNNLFFTDYDSKFGSLILLRKPFLLNLSAGILPLQIGRTVFKLHSSWGSQAAETFCCKSIRDDEKILNLRNLEKIDEFEISEDGLEELSFEEMLMFSGNSDFLNHPVF